MIPNTLKSVSVLSDSVGVDPLILLMFIEGQNKAVDSIGYPDAGYKLWLVQSDTVKDLLFLRSRILLFILSHPVLKPAGCSILTE